MGSVMRFHKLQTLEKLSEEERKKLDDFIMQENEQEKSNLLSEGYIDLFDVWDAIYSGNEEIVSLIVRASIDVNMHNGMLICDAVGNSKIVKMFIDAGADITSECLIRYAAYYQLWDTAKVLIDAGADVTVRNNLPLKYALSNKDTRGVSMLIDAGARIQEEWPLEYLEAKDDFQIIDSILSKDIESCDNKFNKIIAIIIRNLLKFKQFCFKK